MVNRKRVHSQRFVVLMERHTDAVSYLLLGGSGLGLSIVHNIVQKMHGRITVKSEVGKGSTFTVVVGFAQPSALDLSVALSNEICSPAHKKQLQKQHSSFLSPNDNISIPSTPVTAHILVVDDNGTNRKIMSRILSGMNYQVDTACDGLDAINKINQQPHKYNAVFMDISMPNMVSYQEFASISSR